MRTLIKGYTFTAGTRSIDCSNCNSFDIENIRLIVNETQKVIICSSMQKDLIVSIIEGVITYAETLPLLSDGDKLTIEIDKGENYPNSIAVLSEIVEAKKDISDAIILKGGVASEVASFAELVDNINDIPNFNLYGTTWQAGYEPTSAIEAINNKGLYLTEINNTIVQYVDYYAFSYCTNITTLSLPAAQTIGTAAFNNCTNITTLSLPAAQTIGAAAFQYCSNITTISLPAAQTIGAAAFQYCSNITTISLPAAQTIGAVAFQSCTNITTVTFGKLTSFSSANTFLYCYKLVNIIIGVGTNINLDFSSLSSATWNDNINASIWNDNFVSGIINNLFDFTSGAAHTIKCGAYPYAKLTSETRALAAAKNWNITA
jgi:hypothetical protein